MTTHDERTTRLALCLGDCLVQQGKQVTTAESCTGGGIAEAITRIAGSSTWFEAGYVTYSNGQKTAQLQVDPQLFEQVGAVSAEVVDAMVRGAQRHSGAHYAVAVSGIAGPGGGTPEKPVGTVWIAWAAGDRVHTRLCHFQGDRQSIRQQTVVTALDGLVRLTAGENPTRG